VLVACLQFGCANISLSKLAHFMVNSELKDKHFKVGLLFDGILRLLQERMSQTFLKNTLDIYDSVIEFVQSMG
jgi:hypothetical protein